MEFIHLKLTESLQRALEKAKDSDNHIIFIGTDDNQLVRIENKETGEAAIFTLESESSDSKYSELASLETNRARYCGPITHRFRTIADNESFKFAREELIREAEQSRQHKVITIDFEDVCSSKRKIQSARNSRTQKRTFLQMHSDIISKTTSKPDPVLRNINTPPSKARHVRSQVNQSTSSALSAPIKSAKESRPSFEPTNQVPSFSQRCALAAHRRRELEGRLALALQEEDKFARERVIEEIRQDLIALVEELRKDYGLTAA